jgi:predicted DNA-binding antitoxin AbrB/MazE fold protein
MTDTLIAVFKDGAFRPESPCDLPEGSRVVLSIKDASSVAPPEVKSVEERRRIRREVVERMMRNPLPPDAPRFKRSDMYDRD